jgi:DNA polymerase-3 subunit epsilon
VALPGETDLVLRWLAQPGVRLVHLDGEWTCPVGGAAAARSMLAATTVSLPTP